MCPRARARRRAPGCSPSVPRGSRNVRPAPRSSSSPTWTARARPRSGRSSTPLAPSPSRPTGRMPGAASTGRSASGLSGSGRRGSSRTRTRSPSSSTRRRRSAPALIRRLGSASSLLLDEVRTSVARSRLRLRRARDRRRQARVRRRSSQSIARRRRSTPTREMQRPTPSSSTSSSRTRSPTSCRRHRARAREPGASLVAVRGEPLALRPSRLVRVPRRRPAGTPQGWDRLDSTRARGLGGELIDALLPTASNGSGASSAARAGAAQLPASDTIVAWRRSRSISSAVRSRTRTRGAGRTACRGRARAEPGRRRRGRPQHVLRDARGRRKSRKAARRRRATRAAASTSSAVGRTCRARSRGCRRTSRSSRYRARGARTSWPATSGRSAVSSRRSAPIACERSSKIQDGCSFSCSFCVIPSVRGASRSRSAAAVLAEIRRRVEQGHREVVLTGINLGCYRDREAGYGLARLMREAGEIAGLARLAALVDRGEPSGRRSSSRRCARRRPSRATSTSRCSPATTVSCGRWVAATRRPPSCRRLEQDRGFQPDHRRHRRVPGRGRGGLRSGPLATVEQAGITKVHVFPVLPATGNPNRARRHGPAGGQARAERAATRGLRRGLRCRGGGGRSGPRGRRARGPTGTGLRRRLLAVARGRSDRRARRGSRRDA